MTVFQNVSRKVDGVSWVVFRDPTYFYKRVSQIFSSLSRGVGILATVEINMVGITGANDGHELHDRLKHSLTGANDQQAMYLHPITKVCPRSISTRHSEKVNLFHQSERTQFIPRFDFFWRENNIFAQQVVFSTFCISLNSFSRCLIGTATSRCLAVSLF